MQTWICAKHYNSCSKQSSSVLFATWPTELSEPLEFLQSRQRTFSVVSWRKSIRPSDALPWPSAHVVPLRFAPDRQLIFSYRDARHCLKEH